MHRQFTFAPPYHKVFGTAVGINSPRKTGEIAVPAWLGVLTF
jgi:hypothetical protein